MMTRSRAHSNSYMMIAIAALGAMVGCAADVEPEAEARDSLGQFEQAATSVAQWLPKSGWISEESGQGDTGGVSCPAGMAVVGVECMGDFCDNLRIRCDTFQSLGSWRWTHWVEHTAGQDAKCGTNEWMTGIKCWGDWCDNVSIRCSASSTWRVENEDCYWTAQLYSEEQGAYTTPSFQYIAGVHCEGLHCDNKRYWVCKTRPAPGNSCNGRCGGVSSGGTCYCDGVCSNYGDCCTDYGRYCL
jgi:hypothetical protein